jgi:hypothetical protein
MKDFDKTIKKERPFYNEPNLKSNRQSIFKYKKMWSFPQRTEEFCKTHLFGKILHVCCGQSLLGNTRIDIEKQPIQDTKPGFKLGNMYNLPLENNTFDSALIDPVWNIPYNKRMSFLYEIRDKIKINGILLLNAPFVPKIKCMKLQDVYYGERSFYMNNVSLISIYKKIQDQINIIPYTPHASI